ncbi:alpha/beta hydrolase [Puia dinghuensis]|uniref:Alpha/beta hydrolase n=1 Tax=Puia dinghuensis TaxID=1792502 RepID=A0A8J2XTD6_9BACT|nr:alpha/beta hydrolase [Puia dinghuensis]GGB02579.1 alpha/beta hydrolase [Puia dinghuensis]
MKNSIFLNSIKAISVAGSLLMGAIVTGAGTSPVKPHSHAATRVNNIVLVHGAWADGSGWEGVYKILKGKGYNVTVVSNPNTSLAEDVRITKAVLAQQDGPVILVGHSYGGAIITEAGDESIVKGLVYVAAFAPDAGESLFKMQQGAPADPNSPVLPPKDGFIWLDRAKFHAAFCADVPAAQADFMAASQVPPGLAAFSTDLTTAAWKNKKSWYIVSKQDHMIPPDVERSMAKRAGSVVTEIDASHAVYVSHPAEVAAVIEKAANN